MGNESRLEEGLREVRLRRPPTHVRSELLLAAQREARSRRRLRRVTWALVAAAALLLVVNLVAMHVYTTAAASPGEGPYMTPEVTLGPTSYEAIQTRYHAITNAVVPNGDHAGDHAPRGE